MGLKEDYLDALQELPNGIKDFLTTPLPIFFVVGWPEDVDAAIIAQGQLAANINMLLKTFEGLTPVELFLRIGQYNTVLRDMLLTGMEYVSKSLHTFEIEEPQADQYSETDDIPIRVVITDGEEFIESVSCNISGGVGTYDLMQDTEDPSVFTGEIMLAPDTYIFTFTATFTDTNYQPGESITVQVNEQS